MSLIRIGAEPMADRPTAIDDFEDDVCWISSLYVFHSPHDGHLPIHVDDDAPQLLQTYTDFNLAISTI